MTDEEDPAIAVSVKSYLEHKLRYMPWLMPNGKSSKHNDRHKEVLRRAAGAQWFGLNSFVSEDAYVFTETFSIGDHSWVASGAIIRGEVNIGNESSINAYVHIAGRVIIGDHVMIASHASIYGFNHGYSSTHQPMLHQEHVSQGVTIGDDVWIGANAVIIDGVRIGSHTIIAGGAVVTKDIPSYSVVAGNPGRVIRSRIGESDD